MIFGLAVICRSTRESADISVASIAAKADVSASTIHKFEQGKTWPRRIEAVVHAYAVTSGEDARELWKEAVAFMRE